MAESRPSTPASIWSDDETVVEMESPLETWSPTYSTAPTLVESDDEIQETVYEANIPRSSIRNSPSNDFEAEPSQRSSVSRLQDSGSSDLLISPDFVRTAAGQGSEETEQNGPSTPTSILSGNTLVPSPTESWSSGYSSTATISESAQDDLSRAVEEGDVLEVESLCLLGVALSATNLKTLYDACLQGPRMIDALSTHPQNSFDRIIPHQQGDTIFHAVLRTPASAFRNQFAQDFQLQKQLDYHAKTEVIRKLLEKEIDLTSRNWIGDTILHTLSGDFGLPDLEIETEGYHLLKAFFCFDNQGFGEHIRELCLSMVNCQNSGWVDIHGQRKEFLHTPLGVAILYNNLASANLLLDNGADPEIPGEWQQPPIFFAVRNDSEGAVRLLLGHGATITEAAIDEIRSESMQELIRTFREKKQSST